MRAGGGIESSQRVPVAHGGSGSDRTHQFVTMADVRSGLRQARLLHRRGDSIPLLELLCGGEVDEGAKLRGGDLFSSAAMSVRTDFVPCGCYRMETLVRIFLVWRF